MNAYRLLTRSLMSWRFLGGFHIEYIGMKVYSARSLHRYWVCSSRTLQGKLFQRCTNLLYCSVLSLGGNVNTRQMSQPDMESIFTKIIYETII